ncbi:MAG: gamma-glutamyltransferase, partial [Rhodospirillales bacterium]|nr:gamma-glutamyltransferase [Rhodospirillales bacterium]
HRPGTLIQNPDMARTLKRIANDGIEVFYEGEIGQAIAAEMEANGGLLSLGDLTTYRTETAEPLWGEYRGHRISTNPPPGGGVTVLEALHILENFDLAALGHNTPGYIRVVSDAMKRASADRLNHVADPAFVEVPIDRLLGKDYARDHATAIKHGERAQIARYKGGRESANTTHISAVDGDGNAVSMTHTLGMPSGVIPEGLGILLNGSMNLFDPRPGHAASIAPGKARPSSIAPSIVFKGDDPFLVIGAPGGAYITMGILQVILNVIDFAMPVTDAVAAARFSATGNAIEVSNRIPRLITDELEAEGYEVERQYFSYGFSGVHAILIEDGQWTGAADPGRDGMALEV